MRLVFSNLIYNSTFFTPKSGNGAGIICRSQYKEIFSIEKRNIMSNHHLLRHVESIALNFYLKLFASLQIFRYARAPQVNVVFIVTYIDRHISIACQTYGARKLYYFHPRFRLPKNVTRQQNTLFPPTYVVYNPIIFFYP